jgi:hypothetical protein
MKERELFQEPISSLPCYDVEETEPVEAHQPVSNDSPEGHMRPMRTISLRDCAIPE